MGKMTMCELEARINVDSLKRPKFPPHGFCFLFSRTDFFFFFLIALGMGGRGAGNRDWLHPLVHALAGIRHPTSWLMG